MCIQGAAREALTGWAREGLSHSTPATPNSIISKRGQVNENRFQLIELSQCCIIYRLFTDNTFNVMQLILI